MAVYPWFAFYPADYLRKVGHLPIATQGLWMWLLCKMDESPHRGVLLYPNGETIEDKSLAKLVNDTPGNVHRALVELEQNGVLSRDPETAAMYSRRMVRDDAKRGHERDKKAKQRGQGGNVPAMSPAMSPPVSPVELELESELDKTVRAKPRFTKPSLEAVTTYCRERKNTINPASFLDHYESNGWRVGKNAMKDWKAAVRTWERNDFSGNAKAVTNGIAPR